MKTIIIFTRWEASDWVEVPDDFDINDDDQSWMEQVDAGGAALVDWWVVE